MGVFQIGEFEVATEWVCFRSKSSRRLRSGCVPDREFGVSTKWVFFRSDSSRRLRSGCVPDRGVRGG